MMPSCTLVPMGNGVFSGNVAGHPAPGTSLTATRLTHDTMKVRLHQGGHVVGTGLLRLADGLWTGSVDEFAGRWFLEARKGSAEVRFHEHAPAEAGAA